MFFNYFQIAQVVFDKKKIYGTPIYTMVVPENQTRGPEGPEALTWSP